MFVLVPWRPFRYICLLAHLLLLLLLISIAPTVHCFSFPTSLERTVVLLLHKPPNVVTSHVSNDDRSTVYDQVQDMTAYVGKNNNVVVGSFEDVTKIRSKLHAIGRLDADTTGLILITNDGGLVHHVTNKNAASLDSGSGGGGNKIAVTKTYQALVMGHQTEESLCSFWDGVDIGTKYGGMTMPVDDLKILNHPTHKSTIVELTISEGKNRQVRRMFHSIGSGVMQLKRVAIGGGNNNSNDDYSLTLEGLQEGQWRILSEEEVRNALQWEPKVLEEKTVGKGRRSSRSGPKGQRSSLPSDQPKGRRGRPSGKRRRNNDSRTTNSTRTRRR